MKRPAAATAQAIKRAAPPADASILKRIISRVADSLHSDGAVDALCEELSTTLGVRAGGVFLFDRRSGGSVLRKEWGRIESDPPLDGKTEEGKGPSSDRWVAEHVRITARGETVGILVLLQERDRPFSAAQIEFFRTLGREVGFAIDNANVFERLEQSNVDLQSLSRQIVEAQENERRRIGRDLHDGIGQLLTGLKYRLETVRRSDPREICQQLEAAEQVVAELISEVRNLSLDLRPQMLDDLGLLPALRSQFERYTRSTGIEVVFDHWGIERRFEPAIETAVFRIIQEALTNVARHAQVTRVTVRTWATAEWLCLQMEDAGVGFCTAAATPEAGAGGGMSIMKERAELLGGQLRVDTQSGVGTIIAVEIPIRHGGRRPS